MATVSKTTVCYTLFTISREPNQMLCPRRMYERKSAEINIDPWCWGLPQVLQEYSRVQILQLSPLGFDMRRLSWLWRQGHREVSGYPTVVFNISCNFFQFVSHGGCTFLLVLHNKMECTSLRDTIKDIPLLKESRKRQKKRPATSVHWANYILIVK